MRRPRLRRLLLLHPRLLLLPHPLRLPRLLLLHPRLLLPRLLRLLRPHLRLPSLLRPRRQPPRTSRFDVPRPLASLFSLQVRAVLSLTSLTEAEILTLVMRFILPAHKQRGRLTALGNHRFRSLNRFRQPPKVCARMVGMYL